MTSSFLPFPRAEFSRRRACLAACVALGLGGSLRAALPATGPATSASEALDRQMPALLEKWQVPGAAVAVALDGRIVLARGYGYADREAGRVAQPDTRFRTASLAKPITAALTLHLADEGRLSLDDRAFPLLNYATPTYAGARRDARLDQITIRHLLSHAGGWNRDAASLPFPTLTPSCEPTYYQAQIAALMGAESPATAETTARFMVGQPLQFAPGNGFAYSNVGYLILGRVIEAKTGRPYEQAVQQFLARAGISGEAIASVPRSQVAADEAVAYDAPGAMLLPSVWGEGLVPRPYSASTRTLDAHGGWAISALEYLRFMLALDGRGGTVPLLTPATAAAMRRQESPYAGYGYGWMTHYEPYGGGGHNGDLPGTFTMAVRSDDGRVTWVVMCNSCPSDARGELQTSGLMTEVLAAMHGTEVQLRAAAAPPHDFAASTLGWAAWQRKFFGEAAPDALEDSDHDGVPNLLEYAAGLDPQGGEAVSPVSFGVGAEHVPVFTYRRIILGHPVAWTVEGSEDGRSWRAVDPSGARTVLNADGTLSASVAVPGIVRARLRVAQPVGGASTTMEASVAPQAITVGRGGSATLEAMAPAGVALQWRRNGVAVAGATGASLVLTNIQPADVGLYTVDIAGGEPATSLAAVVAMSSTEKVIGGGEEVGADIRHPNGNIYDQVLLTGAAATITADPRQVTRVSFVDLTQDIVQVEFSGAGSLTVVLAEAAGPDLPASYNQAVRYMKGHATLVVANADATTNVAAFSVGKATAANQALFKDGVAYDGVADLAAVAILSPTEKAGGVFLGNAHLFAAGGCTGIYAAGVAMTGPVRVGDMSAFDQAAPLLAFGSLTELSVHGGALEQDNQRPVPVEGLARIRFAAGGRSDGTALPVQANRARLLAHGVDVTTWIIAP